MRGQHPAAQRGDHSAEPQHQRDDPGSSQRLLQEHRAQQRGEHRGQRDHQRGHRDRRTRRDARVRAAELHALAEQAGDDRMQQQPPARPLSFAQARALCSHICTLLAVTRPDGQDGRADPAYRLSAGCA